MSRINHKPLSFSTTMRNPERIASFLQVIKDFDGQILDEDLIKKIVSKTLKNKLYKPMYITRNSNLNNIHKDENANFSDAQVEEIILNSPQKHKEAGFPKGWPSRFDTWYKLIKEFGFLYYEMDKQIEISKSGYMLCDAYSSEEENSGEKIQNIFCNALVKYQTNNPFRRNANYNAPIPLLLNVLKEIKNDEEENGAGIYRKELPFLICWPNNNYIELYNFIKDFRRKWGYRASDEVVYEKCLEFLKTNNRKKFKMNQIMVESVDDLVRKLRITGLFSLRGMGRFIDIDKFETEKINYIIDIYSEYEVFDTEYSYFKYMGSIDPNIIKSKQISTSALDDIRSKALVEFSKKFNISTVSKELLNLKNGRDTKDSYLKLIEGPTRLEFLTSIYLVQNYPELLVKPNYAIDDEGNPTFTARGGVADILVEDNSLDSTVEVTLMRNRQQSTNEIPAITRHLLELRNDSDKEEVFSLFIAPNIHEDTKYMCQFTKVRNDLDIYYYDIENFTEKVKNSNSILDLAFDIIE